MIYISLFGKVFKAALGFDAAVTNSVNHFIQFMSMMSLLLLLLIYCLFYLF